MAQSNTSRRFQDCKVADPKPLWDEFRSGASAQVREQIIATYLPFARMLAAKTYARRTYAELEFLDYLQCATVGLVEAVDRFDTEHGVKFETFATPRITGAILSGISTLSEKQEQVGTRRRIASDRIKSMKDKPPCVTKPDDIFVYLAELAIGLAVGFALEDTGMHLADESITYADNTYQRVELKQLQQQVRDLLESLTGNAKKVVTYHYLQQIAFDEIAMILGLTKGRVSQIHRDALKKLKEGLRNEGRFDFSC